MLTHTFIFNLPCSNHVHRLPDVMFKIKATLDDFGYIYFIPPSSEDILNEEEMYRDIVMLARIEFEKKEERIADGERILSDLFGPNKTLLNTLHLVVLMIVAFIVLHHK